MIVKMSNKFLALWGFIIIGILFSILLIGFNEKDLKYFKLEHNLKLASRAYIKNNKINTNINDSYVIFSSDLKEKGYITKDELDEYCIDKVTYYNGIIFDKYIVSKNCE